MNIPNRNRLTDTEQTSRLPMGRGERGGGRDQIGVGV